MANNIIDLDPQTRLTKEALIRIKETVNAFTVEDLDSFVMLYTKKEGGVVFEGFGVDWRILGIGQAYLEALRADLLYGPLSESDDD